MPLSRAPSLSPPPCRARVCSLGAGESGKSTIFKQMKIINKDGYTKKEKLEFVSIIYSNTVQSMNVLMEAFAKVGCDMPGDLKALKDTFDEKKGRSGNRSHPPTPIHPERKGT
jgi:hypothetical protein